jgi:biotin operon repressor
VHKAQPSECEIVRTLVEAAGQYVTGPELQHGPGCKGKKIWKVIKGVETAIPEITKYLEHGGNKGYRLLQGSD